MTVKPSFPGSITSRTTTSIAVGFQQVISGFLTCVNDQDLIAFRFEVEAQDRSPGELRPPRPGLGLIEKRQPQRERAPQSSTLAFRPGPASMPLGNRPDDVQP